MAENTTLQDSTDAEAKPHKATKIAIVGSAASSKDRAPWEDPDFEIWGLAWRGDLKRFDRMFEMHGLGPDRKRIPDDYKQRLANLRCPVYMIEHHADVPNSVPFPINEARQYLSQFGVSAPDAYFASSIGFQMVLAMMEGFQEIHIYGVDLIADDEWSYQRPNLEYLIGLARGAGIQVYIPETSALCKFTHVYGYEQDPGPVNVLTPGVLDEMYKEYTQKKDEALIMLHKYDGAIQNIQHMQAMLKGHKRGAQLT